MTNITNIPAPRVPFIDERTGQISREWFRFLNNQFVLTGSGQTSVTTADLELTPALASTVEDIAPVLESEIQGLKVAPVPPVPAFADYGMFYDTTTQTAAVANTAYAVTFNTDSFVRGVRRGSPTSRILVSRPGIYNVAFSLQLDKTSGGLAPMYFWGRKNGTNIAQSGFHTHLQGNNNEVVFSGNLFVDLGADDYFELMWSTADTTAQLTAYAAAAPVPAIPSAILTVSQVNL